MIPLPYSMLHPTPSESMGGGGYPILAVVLLSWPSVAARSLIMFVGATFDVLRATAYTKVKIMPR